MASKQIKIIVFCGTALATSTVASMKLKEELDKKGVQCKITTGRISDMQSLVELSNPDVVVSTAVTNMDIGMPIFNGIPLLTGFNVDSLVDEIMDYLKTKELI